MAERPDGWHDAYERRFQSYVERKGAAGEPARDREGWRTASEQFQSINADGDAFRDAAWQELGFDRQEWRIERHEPTVLGGRRYDIGSIEDQIGYEFKLGGGRTDFTMSQLAKDEINLQRDWDVTWVCDDMSKLSGPVRDRLADLQQKYPDQFHAYDLSAIRARGDDFQPRTDLDRQAQQLAKMNFTRPSQLDPQAAEALQHSQAGFNRPASEATHGPGGPDPGNESGRTAAFDANRRRSQAHGKVTNGPVINSSGVNGQTPGRTGSSR